MGRGSDGHTPDRNNQDRSRASGESMHGVTKQIRVESDPKSEERQTKIVKESRKLLKKTSSKSWVQRLNAFKGQVVVVFFKLTREEAISTLQFHPIAAFNILWQGFGSLIQRSNRQEARHLNNALCLE
jgi:hypothetical protein